MKRVMQFTDEKRSQKRFELLYSSVLIGSGARQQAAGIEIVRREARLLDALDSVSTTNTDPSAPKIANSEPARLVTLGAAVLIEQADYEVLKKRLEDTPWAPFAARDVVDVVDWLSTAPTQE